MLNLFFKKKKVNQRRSERPSGKRDISYARITSAICALTVGLALYGGYYLTMRSPYFTVTEIKFSERKLRTTVDYGMIERLIRGRNTFTLNLRELEKNILNTFSELCAMLIIREFPNRIVLEVRYRKPVAQLEGNRYYMVDRDGIVLPEISDIPKSGYPIISGIAGRFDLMAGKRCKSENLGKALTLLERIQETGLAKRHPLYKINVANMKNISFFLEGGLEVRIGGEEFTARLEKLAQLLADPKIKPNEVLYIDLRFKDPVINPKWTR